LLLAPAGGYASTVAGGALNVATGNYAAVSGGEVNYAYGAEATVAGGSTNSALNEGDAVGGGENNTANSFENGECGGDNAATCDATVAGGNGNAATSGGATVGGGGGNVAANYGATVPGGSNNQALAIDSFAAGQSAIANYDNSFVWGGCGCGPTQDTGPNQFIASAVGGFTFYTGFYTGAQLPSGSGSWSSLSDRNVKANFATIDGEALLAKLAELPISTWNYKAQDASIRHMGPMAQDFHAAFGLGEDDKHIPNIDSEGAVQTEPGEGRQNRRARGADCQVGSARNKQTIELRWGE
jgi:hypothetical protein